MKKYNIHKTVFYKTYHLNLKSNCCISRIIVTWYMEQMELHKIIMEEHK